MVSGCVEDTDTETQWKQDCVNVTRSYYPCLEYNKTIEINKAPPRYIDYDYYIGNDYREYVRGRSLLVTELVWSQWEEFRVDTRNSNSTIEIKVNSVSYDYLEKWKTICEDWVIDVWDDYNTRGYYNDSEGILYCSGMVFVGSVESWSGDDMVVNFEISVDKINLTYYFPIPNTTKIEEGIDMYCSEQYNYCRITNENKDLTITEIEITEYFPLETKKCIKHGNREQYTEEECTWSEIR